jgi:L-sorbose 1-phosphate reductase
MTTTLPQTQFAVQLAGPSDLRLNRAKPVVRPGAHEILLQIEAVGLCFSDLKLLKQFSAHPRKAEIVGGLAPEVLQRIQSYVPGERPTVPGHEVACRIVAVGDQVRHHRIGERCIVQADYRDLPTRNSNGAFGYNFEGGLQEYCIVDERVAIDARGDRFLIPVGEEKSASAVALVEPWACVENSYANRERRQVKPGGRLLVVADAGAVVGGLGECVTAGKPAAITALCHDAAQLRAVSARGVAVTVIQSPAALPDDAFDDIIYFGADKATLEILNDKLAPGGILNIVLGGRSIGALVSVGVGRVHYGRTRWIGTPGSDAAESYQTIPAVTEIRPGERIVVIGAGGPMGQMHVIRNLCSGVAGISLVGADVDDARLAALAQKAQPLAAAGGVPLSLVNTTRQPLAERFSYWALMAPVPQLIAQAIAAAHPGAVVNPGVAGAKALRAPESGTQGINPGAIINIFAGIPAPTRHPLDLDAYIRGRCFMFGTSGSVIEDMRIVLRKVEGGQLDTNASVDAVAGMAGAAEGIRAVEERTLAGKIIVYPMLHDLGLIPLSELHRQFPTVAAKLDGGRWTLAAERELLAVAT